ncbi:hypothetical protein MACJ_002115 [Theileria orientalis]|uniref:Nucleoside transporter n=1 Tax=Theileria orientalis TaxID=68886 RepID=A0A976M5N9_THEOR|nr:hypothetical protein MACJ_002115 [Theileria orientalis]
MADRTSERVGNLSSSEYDEKNESTGTLSYFFGLLLGLANNFSSHTVFLLCFLSVRLLKGSNKLPLNLFLFFFFYALGSALFFFLSPVFSFFTFFGYLLEGVFHVLALLSVQVFETEAGRGVFTASVALLGLAHGLNKAVGVSLVEATPFGSHAVLDMGLFLSGLLPFFLYMVFRFVVTEGGDFKNEHVKVFFTTVSVVAVVVHVLAALFSVVYSMTGTVKRHMEKKRLEQESKPRFVGRHAGSLFNNLLVSTLVFLVLYFLKYTLFPSFYPLDVEEKVTSGAKYMFLTLPGLFDGFARLAFLYLFGRIDWTHVTPCTTLYMLVFDLLLVLFFGCLHRMQDQDFVLFEESFSLLFFMGFLLVHSASSDVITLQFLSHGGNKDSERDMETHELEADVPRAHKRVTAHVFLNFLESLGSTIGSLAALLFFNLSAEKK